MLPKNLLLAPGATSFLLITTSKDADLDAILRRLNGFSDVNALTKRQMASNDLKLFAKVFLCSSQIDGCHCIFGRER